MSQTFVNPIHPEDAPLENRPSVLETVLLARYFIPALSTVGAIMCFIGGGTGVVSLMGMVFILIGVVSALTVCPLKLLSFPLMCAGKGFSLFRAFVPVYGLGDIIAALLGVTFGFMFGLAVAACCPVIFTLIKYFEN